MAAGAIGPCSARSACTRRQSFIAPVARFKSVADVVHSDPQCDVFIGRRIALRYEHDRGVNACMRMLVPMSRTGRMLAFGFRVPISTMLIPTPSVASIRIRDVRDILRNSQKTCVGRVESDINTGAHKTFALVEFGLTLPKEPSRRRMSFAAHKSCSNRATIRKLSGTSATNDLSPRL